jgi:hypothetical protein
MSKCAAGVELLRRGTCPKCGATNREPCPEAFRIANEERQALISFAEFIRDGYARCDINHVDFRVGAYKAALDVLARVGSVK